MLNLYKNKKWLYNKYINEKLSANQIGKICNVSNESIQYQLKKYNISRRSQSESVHLSKANHCDLSQKAIEWINGEMLGDGCICKISPYSARFQYASKYLEYIRYISNTLKSFGIEQSGKINKQHKKEYNCYYYDYKSRSYVELLPIQKQWYPYGKKIVPRDIVLTPITVRQWYIGDGSLKCEKNKKYSTILCTNNFLINNIKQLIEKLHKLGFKSTRQPADNIIHISVHSTKDFIDYMGKCPVKCYQYKWNYKDI